MESRCFIVRSSTVTPMAATQSIDEMRILSIVTCPFRPLLVRFVERFAAGKTGFDVVPILDALFAELPAQVHNAPLTHVGEIAEPLVRVLEDDPHFLDVLNQKHEV